MFKNFCIFKKERNKFLLLDFGRKTVRGVIFQLNNSKVKILNFQEEEIQRHSVFDGMDFELDVVKKTTEKIIEKIGIKKEILKLSKILYFSPDILRAEIFDLSIKRQFKDKKIKKEEDRQICEFVFNEAKKKLFEKQGSQIKILKKKILIEKISGYKVSSILGFKAENLSFKVLIVFCSKSYFDFLEKIKENLNLENSEIFHPIEPLINLINKQFLREETTRIFIDIGEKNTLVSFFGKEPEFVVDFPAGGSDFTKELCRIFNFKKDEAEILKENFSEKKLSPETEKKLREIFQPSLNFWLENFRKKIKEKVNVNNLFADFYLFGGGSLLPLFKEELGKEIGLNKVKFLLPSDLPLKNKTKMKFSIKETSSLLKVFYLS